MKKYMAIALAATLACAPVLAQTGGFVDPNAPAASQTAKPQSGFLGGALVTAEKAKSLSDDAWVTLRGTIEQRIGEKDYLFRDASGTIKVEISHKRWNGLTITPQDTVEIQGKVDKEWNEIEIDVKQLKKIN